MITSENGKLAKKALTKVKIKLILLQKLVEDYELYNSIQKITTGGSSTVDYINTCIDGINYQFNPDTGKMVALSTDFKTNITAAHNTAKQAAEAQSLSVDQLTNMNIDTIHKTIDKSTEIISITDTEVETMYTTQINEIKSSITTLLSEIEGYIVDHC